MRVLTGWLSIVLIPAEVLDTPGVSIAQLPVQFAAGGLLGGLRHKTGTLVPGAAVHAVVNVAAVLLLV